MTVSERTAVLAAVLSSGLGGVAAAATRFVIGGTDPVTLAALRFGSGFIFLLPVTLAVGSRWPQGKDWIGVTSLGLLFFAVFFVVYNVALIYTTAARGTLALSTLPLLTMAVAALFRIEPLTSRKTAGVLIAMTGVAIALATGLAGAPSGAWRGDLVMGAAALCMALYNVWSRPFIARSGPLSFTTAGMGVGALCLTLITWWRGGFAAAGSFDAPQWAAIAYLGLGGSALTFYLWGFALERTTPTRVASTIMVNPVTASVVAAIALAEPIGLDLIVGVATVFTGIWIASTDRRAHPPLLGAGPSPLWTRLVVRAQELLTQVYRACGHEAGAAVTEAQVLRILADMAAGGTAPDFDKAQGLCREALDLAEELGMRPLAAHCHLGLGQLYRRKGEPREAREHITIAMTAYREMNMRFWREQAEAELKNLA